MHLQPSKLLHCNIPDASRHIQGLQPASSPRSRRESCCTTLAPTLLSSLGTSMESMKIATNFATSSDTSRTSQHSAALAVSSKKISLWEWLLQPQSCVQTHQHYELEVGAFDTLAEQEKLMVSILNLLHTKISVHLFSRHSSLVFLAIFINCEI